MIADFTVAENGVLDSYYDKRFSSGIAMHWPEVNAASAKIVTDSPGSICSTLTFGASFCSSAGVPVSTGKVPQWQGTQRFAWSSSSATTCRPPPGIFVPSSR